MACDGVQFSFHNGNGIKLFTSNDIISATWVRSLSAVGKATITVPSAAPGFDFDIISQQDFGMTIETATGPEQPYRNDLETYWFLLKLVETRNEDEEMYTMTFGDSMTLLDRRIVPYLSDPSKTGQSRTFMIGQAAVEMARIVSNAMGPLATPEFKIDQFSVAPVGFASPTLRKSVAFRRIMNVLTQSAGTSKYNGVPLYFDVIATPRSDGVAFTFRLYKDLRGADFRDEIIRTTDPLFRLESFELNRDLPNDAIVSGAGRETDRLLGRATAPEATTSDFSRNQTFKFSVSRDSRVLQSEAEQLVSDAGGSVKIKAQLLGDLANKYSFGDRLIIEHRNIRVDCIVSSIRSEVREQEFKRNITLTSISTTLDK